MWTQLQSITNGAAALRQPSRAGLAAIVTCTLGLVVTPEAVGAQSVNDGGAIVQPNTTPAAVRHRAHATRTDALVDAAVRQAPAQRTVREGTRMREAAKTQNSSHAKPLNRTAQAHLETSGKEIGLPPVAMICQNCEPEPPCKVWRCGNSPIVAAATIAVER